MLNFGPTFIWAIVNLLILYMILRVVLFKRVTNLMQNRTNSIRNDLESAQRAKAEAAELKQKFEDQLSAARVEADRIINEARERAEKEYASIIKAAHEEAERYMEKKREEMDAERTQMIREVKAQVAGLALAAASKVMEANMDNESNRILVDKFIDKAGVA